MSAFVAFRRSVVFAAVFAALLPSATFAQANPAPDRRPGEGEGRRGNDQEAFQ